MQTSKLVKKNNKLIDEKFRPSPNFKNMRKYLKSKWEERYNSSYNLGSDPSTTRNNKEQGSAKQTQNIGQQVNPPLPPYPPPPDSPIMVPKQEVVIKEYKDLTCRTVAVSEKTMCRQFARGTCTRGASCIFAHELILSQLHGLYTFCNQFQNGNCTILRCRFVHATVFEKEHFYRTGYLPPHTLVHLKESNKSLTPPRTQAGAMPDFSVPPPPLYSRVSVLPTKGSTPASDVTKMKQKSEDYSKSVASNKMGTPTKREWKEIDTGMPPEYYSEPSPETCNTCHITELKLQCQYSKMRTLLKAKESYAKQNRELLKWDFRLNMVLERTKKELSMAAIKFTNDRSSN